MVDKLTFLVVIVQKQIKGEDNKTGYNHVVQSLEVFNLKHEWEKRLSEGECFLWSLLWGLVFLDVTLRNAHIDILCKFLPEWLKSNLDVFVELALGLKHVDAFLTSYRLLIH